MVNMQLLPEFVVDFGTNLKDVFISAAKISRYCALTDPKTTSSNYTGVDQDFYYRSNEDLKDACKTILSSEAISREIILRAATDIARLTGSIVARTKAASNDSKLGADVRQSFLSHSKAVASKTSKIVQSLKDLAINHSKGTGNLKAFENASLSLFETTDALVEYVSLPKFTLKEGETGLKALVALKKITDLSHDCLGLSREFVLGLQTPIVTEQDDSQLKEKIKGVSLALDNLVKALESCGPLEEDCSVANENIRKTISVLVNAIDNPGHPTHNIRDGNTNKALIDALGSISSLGTVIKNAITTDYDQVSNALDSLTSTYSQVIFLLLSINN